MNKRLMQVIPSVVLYIFAGLLAIYTIWSLIYCADIISQAKATGQLVAGGNEYDIISFYMGNCGQYFVFALLLAAAGFILHRKQPALSEHETADAPTKNDDVDSEIDEWFKEEGINN